MSSSTDTTAQDTQGQAPTVSPAPSRFKDVLHQLLGTRRVIIGLVMLVVLGLTAFLGPVISPWEVSERDYLNMLEGITSEHWFGTNRTGQDIFTHASAGLQTSLLIGLLVAVISTLVAALVGAFAGYFGGFTYRALMWIADLALDLPIFVILAILSKH